MKAACGIGSHSFLPSYIYIIVSSNQTIWVAIKARQMRANEAKTEAFNTAVPFDQFCVK